MPLLLLTIQIWIREESTEIWQGFAELIYEIRRDTSILGPKINKGPPDIVKIKKGQGYSEFSF